MVRALVLAWAAIVGLCGAPLWAQDVVLGQMYGQGVHAFFAGDYLEAHRLFTAAIEAGTKDPRVYYFRGLCLMNLQRPEQAPADFQRGAELESSEEGRIYNVGRALERVQGRARLEVEKYRVQARMARLAEERRLQQLRFEQLRGQQGVTAQPGQTTPDLPVEPPKPVEPGDIDPFSAPKTKPSEPAQPKPPAETPVESPAEPKPPESAPQPAEPKPTEPQPAEQPAMPELPPAQPEPQPPSEPTPPKPEPAQPDQADPFEPAKPAQPPESPQPQPGQTEPAMPSEPGTEPAVIPPSAGGKSVLGALGRALIKGAAGGESGQAAEPKPQPVPLLPPGVPGQLTPVPPPTEKTEEPTPPAPKTEEPVPPAPPQPATPPAASDDPFSIPGPSKPTEPMKPAVEDPFSLEPPAAKTKPATGKPAPKREPPADPFN